MSNVGVSNVDRSPNGVRYAITRNDDSRIRVGYVEITGSLINVRDAFDEPVMVGSAKYHALVNAVNHYREWAERHNCNV